MKKAGEAAESAENDDGYEPAENATGVRARVCRWARIRVCSRVGTRIGRVR